MSEEEIVEILKDNIKSLKNPISFRHTNEEKIQAIQGLLDLYNKEKEKNKELENADLTLVYMNGFYDGEKKYKDKIKETIKEYEDFRKKYPVEFRKYKMRPIIVVLQEILKKGDK